MCRSCPMCESTDTRVVGTDYKGSKNHPVPKATAANVTRRKRTCQNCRARWYTEEKFTGYVVRQKKGTPRTFVSRVVADKAPPPRKPYAMPAFGYNTRWEL
jgi:transcriptional regulator NrdR family protein